jgi:hypothetical protein
VVTSLACSLGGTGASNESTPVAQVQPSEVPQATTVPPADSQPTLTPAPPTETPPSGSGPSGCVLSAQYVADVTIPDNTVLAPNASFVKTWRVKNNGTCSWDAGYQLVYAEGTQMSGPAGVNVNSTAPGANVDISVNLVAPGAPGTYTGKWRLKASNGAIFGGLTVVIVVPEPPTDTPTPTTTPTPSPTSNFTFPITTVVIITGIIPLLAGSNIDDYLGHWVPNDPSWNGVVVIDIVKKDSTHLGVHAYGKCSPTNCDWTEVTVKFTSEPVVVTFPNGRTLTISMATYSKLHAIKTGGPTTDETDYHK